MPQTSAADSAVKIRLERPEDHAAVRHVNIFAFDTPAEANLVDTLRTSGCTFISLIAESEEKVVGHIRFTPVALMPADSGLRLPGLAPMAVRPDFQRRGVGSALVKTGLIHITALDYDAVAVLGHPHFYPHFGFVPSTRYGIKSEYDVPEEVFMMLELKRDALRGHSGVIIFHDAFARV
jgi:putative acetyltransferase